MIEISPLLDPMDGTAPHKTPFEVSTTRCTPSQPPTMKLYLHEVKKIYSKASEPTDTATPRQRFPTDFSYVEDLLIDARGIVSPADEGPCLEILRSFTNVTSLRIHNWDFGQFESHHVTEILGHFSTTVKTLELLRCCLDSGLLIFLTSLFTLVGNLSVRLPSPPYLVMPLFNFINDTVVRLPGPSKFGAYRVQGPDRSRSVGFRGKILLEALGEHYRDFLAFVNENRSDLHSISVYYCGDMRELQELFSGPQACKLTSVGFGTYSGERKSIPARSTNRSFAVVLTRSLTGSVSFSSCTQLRTLKISLRYGFVWDDPNWKVLHTMTSPHLKEIKVTFFGADMRWDSKVGPEAIDDLLYECYIRSGGKSVSPFHVSLDPIGLCLEGSRGRLVECVQNAWPRFLHKGTVKLPFEPWILGNCEQRME